MEEVKEAPDSKVEQLLEERKVERLALKQKLQEITFDLHTALSFTNKSFKNETIKRVRTKIEEIWNGL